MDEFHYELVSVESTAPTYSWSMAWVEVERPWYGWPLWSLMQWIRSLVAGIAQ